MRRGSPFGPILDEMVSEIIVRNASQLSGTLDPTKAYRVDGVIDMGTTSIKVPEGGLTLLGIDFNISGLTSSADNHTMFVVDPAGAYSGPLNLRSLFITDSGDLSQVFDLDNSESNNAVEASDCNFVSCTSLGELANYRQMFNQGVGWLRCVDGLTFSGNWAGGMTVLSSILISAGVTFNGTLFKAGTALSIAGSVSSDMNALQLGDAGTLFDFAPSNIVSDGAFQMVGVRVNPASTAFPNMPATSVKARFKACTGTRNTYVGTTGTVTTSAETTINTTDVYETMAGTITYTDLAWVLTFGTAGLEFNSDVETDFVLSGAASFTGANNSVLGLAPYKYTAALATWAQAGPVELVTLNAGGRAENVSFGTVVSLSKGDRIEFRVANTTGTQNVTALLGGHFRLTERG